VWSFKIKWFCGPNVEKMGGCVKSLCPIFRRHRGLNKERTNNIVRGPDGSLSFAILGRGVGARESQSCAMRREKEAICVIVEFLAMRREKGATLLNGQFHEVTPLGEGARGELQRALDDLSDLDAAHAIGEGDWWSGIGRGLENLGDRPVEAAGGSRRSKRRCHGGAGED
jgi:hypothetical protein